MWSEAPESMIQGVGFWLQDRALRLLPICARALVGVPDKELDFSCNNQPFYKFPISILRNQSLYYVYLCEMPDLIYHNIIGFL